MRLIAIFANPGEPGSSGLASLHKAPMKLELDRAHFRPLARASSGLTSGRVRAERGFLHLPSSGRNLKAEPACKWADSAERPSLPGRDFSKCQFAPSELTSALELAEIASTRTGLPR